MDKNILTPTIIETTPIKKIIIKLKANIYSNRTYGIRWHTVNGKPHGKGTNMIHILTTVKNV